MPWSHLCVKPPRRSHRIAIWVILDTWLSARWELDCFWASNKSGSNDSNKRHLRGSTMVVTGSTRRLLEILPHKISTFYCRVSYVTGTRIPSLVLRNTWHYVTIRRRKFWFPKMSYVAHTRRLYAKVWPRIRVTYDNFREVEWAADILRGSYGGLRGNYGVCVAVMVLYMAPTGRLSCAPRNSQIMSRNC